MCQRIFVGAIIDATSIMNGTMLDAITANQLKFARRIYEYSMHGITARTRYFLSEFHRMNNRVLYLALEDTLPPVIYNWNIRFNFHRRLPAQS